jgi:hypothetical protein
MKSTTVFILLFALSLVACQSNNKSDEKKSSNKEYEINDKVPPSGENMSASEKAKLEELITESKKTLDSIDVAYSFVRKQSRLQNLSLDEREQVNEALIELNDAKDLIVLEMEQKIINDLKEKTTSLQIVMQDMNTKSHKLMHIAQTLSRISGVIAKTTNLLAGALAVGLIRPRIIPVPAT